MFQYWFAESRLGADSGNLNLDVGADSGNLNLGVGADSGNLNLGVGAEVSTGC